MTVETRPSIQQPIPELNPEIRREDFGPGRTGDIAYKAVSSGIPCANFIDDQQTECGKPPVGTVDIDIQGHVEIYTICSTECKQSLTNQLLSDIDASGRDTFPRYNGAQRL